MMAVRILHRVIFRRRRPNTYAAGLRGTLAAVSYQHQYFSNTAVAAHGENSREESDSKWLILPPFTPFADDSAIGKLISQKKDSDASPTTTALKWILICYPHLPRSLVQKLFRLRQVRRESSNDKIETNRPKRIGAKEFMGIGDRIFLPKSVDGKYPTRIEEKQSSHDEEDSKFVRGLELYKDRAIIVINKPPGMPVQGGLGISRSLDVLASKYLRYDYEESPRLVHRLDRDCSGILVMGRTKLSASVLHSIFREKTVGALNSTFNRERTLQKRYCALVIGSPRRQEGLISTPLGKVVVDNGRSERITVIDNTHTLSAQHAVTEYQVVTSSSSGYTWLELYPHTGRKHQLRVHCAEVLGTPIVGDYKYGWPAHKKLKHILASTSDCQWDENISEQKQVPFNLKLEKGSLSNKTLLLHLHCKEMVLPNISLVLENGNMISGFDAERVDSIKIDAPLPPHMQRNWDLLINR
ncbi:RNA pseudouridine synthase 4, mitochondrial [Primulina tabacum]|uniref:RNA pseudouridine synthase 4, mitochondrial n=1 Tax=Primulina tabacum TaxID=48773 RepID=UPI003F5A5EE2